MAPVKTIIRAYHITDGDLIQKADSIVLLVARDAAEFSTRNVADTTALQAARAAFADFPQDMAMAGAAMVATEAKNTALATVKDEISTLRNMASLAFKARPAIYKSFGFVRFSSLGDNDACRAARLMAALAGLQTAALSAHGFSAAWLLAFNARITAFDEALDAAKLSEAVRIQQTEERVVLGNALHEEASRLASIGQSLFVNTNEAKYNDYVLEPTGG